LFIFYNVSIYIKILFTNNNHYSKQQVCFELFLILLYFLCELILFYSHQVFIFEENNKHLGQDFNVPGG